MALVVNSNVASLTTMRYLNQTTNTLNQTFVRLASGLRVNSAADDAAALSISSRFTSQIRGLNQAVRNSNDGISLVQVADGALDETVNALQRIRELAVQASSDTLVTSDRDDIQTEIDQLISEINRIASDTEFNTQALLNGSFQSKQIAVGMEASSQTITISLQAATASAIGVSGVSVGSAGMASSALTTIDDAITSISDIRATLGALQNRFESVSSNLENVSENMSSARSTLIDADIAYETSVLTRMSILQQAGTAVLAQANQQPQMALQLLS